MKIITIMGSPKKNGKTALTLSLFEERMIKANNEIERINITDANIKPCMECYACTRIKTEHGCPQVDDWDMVIKKILSADAIIYASPLFCFDITAQLKPLIDRHFSLMNKGLLTGKYTALLITCGGEEAGNADLIPIMFRRAFDINQSNKFMTNVVGTYTAASSVSPEFNKTAEEVSEKMFNDFAMYWRSKIQHEYIV